MADFSNFDPLHLGPPSDGYVGIYPRGDGLTSLPVSGELDGIITFDTDNGTRYWVVVGSTAWLAWMDQVDSAGNSTVGWGDGVVEHNGPVDPVTTVRVDPGTINFRAPTAPPPNVFLPEVINDPGSGPVIAGQPTNNGTLATIWRLPGLVVGKFLPHGETLSPLVGAAMLALPFGLLALAAWLLWRHFRK
ncbi:MAG: hypothetical protein DVB31_05445 [Verrucomicrobia bacterium]|nr:MAG: hypothetical protein DVB31_05445 [Verrucomicrobiota bacterium]